MKAAYSTQGRIKAEAVEAVASGPPHKIGPPLRKKC